MEKYSRIATGRNNQRGAVAVMVGILILVLVGFLALSVDTGYLYGTRNELQNAADAAALAAARELAEIYDGLSPSEQATYVFDRSTIIPVAQEVAGKNRAAGEPIIINVPDDVPNDVSDVVIGRWDGINLTPTLNRPNAVKVIISRDEENPEGRVTTFFAGVLGFEAVPVSASAIAALTGPEKGKVELPIGVSETWFNDREEDKQCGEVIKLSPTSDLDACAGWNSFTDSPASNNKIKKILEGDLEEVSVSGGETFEFTNGKLSDGVFEDLLTQFQKNGYSVDEHYTEGSGEPEPVVYVDAEGNLTDASGDPSDVEILKPGMALSPLMDEDGITQLQYPNGELRYAREWKTTIPVYDSPVCNPKGAIRIKGFVDIILYDVVGPPDKIVRARISCDVKDYRGGGALVSGPLDSIQIWSNKRISLALFALRVVFFLVLAVRGDVVFR